MNNNLIRLSLFTVAAMSIGCGGSEMLDEDLDALQIAAPVTDTFLTDAPPPTGVVPPPGATDQCVQVGAWDQVTFPGTVVANYARFDATLTAAITKQCLLSEKPTPRDVGCVFETEIKDVKGKLYTFPQYEKSYFTQYHLIQRTYFDDKGATVGTIVQTKDDPKPDGGNDWICYDDCSGTGSGSLATSLVVDAKFAGAGRIPNKVAACKELQKEFIAQGVDCALGGFTPAFTEELDRVFIPWGKEGERQTQTHEIIADAEVKKQFPTAVSGKSERSFTQWGPAEDPSQACAAKIEKERHDLDAFCREKAPLHKLKRQFVALAVVCGPRIAR